ncbi:hypothetical protein HYU93_05020 [Candidatus Daviesbacteria bacterium]|nr:hypothetical protein [Candidatus Daviesbacteria bacterium]
MKRFVCLSLLSIFFLANTIYSQSPQENTQAATSSSIQSEINYLRNQVESIKKDNYDYSIKSAENAGLKADRLLNWLVGIATIFGVIIALVAFVVGGDLAAKLRELRLYVKAAKKNASLIETIAKEAGEKGEQLSKEIKELQDIKKNIDNSKSKSTEQEIKISELINKAQGTISEIQSLNNSATLISGTTIPYPVNFVKTVDPRTTIAPGGFNVCKKCFSFFKPGQTLFGSLTGNNDYCPKCE